MIINYEFKYRSRGKWFFVPNDKCERRGRRMLAYFKRRVVFPDYMYHFKKGGHVAALHAHLNNSLFFKIDIQNFYYSIARMRVTRALRHWGYPGANTFAEWLCVRNPLGVDEDVRTLHAKRAEWAQEILRDLQTEDGQRILQNIKLLRQRFEPEAVAKEEAAHARRAKAEKAVYRARGDDAPFHSSLPL